MFIQTEETPNPLVMKFIPECKIMEDGAAEYTNIENAQKHPLAKLLFDIDGVESVFINTDFVSVTKNKQKDWTILKTDILCVLVDFFASNSRVDILSEINGNEIKEDDDEIVKQIKILINERIRPAVAHDGGDVVFHSFIDGILYLEMRGACAGCPSAGATLKMGIENMMKHYIPEIVEVREISELREVK